MKATLLILAGVAAVSATLPACGETCVNNMRAKFGDFGCSDSNDTACLCKDSNFLYGIRDCSAQSCGNDGWAQETLQYGLNLCGLSAIPAGSSGAGPGASASSTGAAESTGASETTGAGASGTPGPSAITTSEFVTTVTSDGSEIVSTGSTTIFASGSEGESETPTPSAVTTSAWTSVVTSGSEVATITGEETISGINGVPTPAPILVSPILSTVVTDGSTFLTTIGSTTLATSVTAAPSASESGSESASGSGAGGAGGASSTARSSSSSALAAQMTAAPAVGFLAAAGIAAVLL